MKQRYGYIDWYRGLACVLMFQTHAYDSWTRDADRANLFWWTSRHLGGFPSRLFLFLAGVSLMLRFEGDRKKNKPIAEARWGAAKRGLEVLALGYAFRLSCWLLAGAGLGYWHDLLRVDILNCIGVSLIASAYICSPRDLADGAIPWKPAALALGIVFVTPYLEALHWPHWLPHHFSAYVAGPQPGWFPQFPWCAYTLAGCVAGAFWVRAQRNQKLRTAMLITLGAGVVMAFSGQIARRSGISFYSFGDNQAGPTSPTAFFYRTGMVLIGGVLSWLVCAVTNPENFSWVRQLGKTSLLVYWVHVEMVYGHLSDPIKHKLTLVWASSLLGVLTALMLLLSWLRTEWWPKRRPVAVSPPGSAA